EADWQMMLQIGRGWGIRARGADGREQVAASTVVIPYASRLAWISMVLVLPEFRRRGYASLLLRHALADLHAGGMTGVLDATPAGHVVYVEEGFVDTWGFRRYRREARPGPDFAASRNESIFSRPLRDDDWPAILALDTPAFGADRASLLRALARRLPLAARVAESRGRLCGFVLGRDGREASQLGPLVARDIATARILLDDALPLVDGPVYVDLADRHEALLPCLEARGFRLQRPFTRMVHGSPNAPGDPASVVLVAGPELG
ncbi:MAG: GNAT family N-acetyltransferase, partial [Gammaproteobacteria bacterium]